MHSYKEIYDKLCRLCLSYCDNRDMVSLTENSNTDGLSVYGRAVLRFADISIPNNNLPTLMCKECLTLLKQAILFKMRSESCDKRLKLWNEIYQNTKSDGTPFEEIVVDNILFSKYFPEEISMSEENNKSDVKSFSEDDKSESEGCKSESEGGKSDSFSDENNDEIQRESDIDSADEILNIMEADIGKYSEGENVNLKAYIHRRLLLKKRRQAKLMAKQYKRQYTKTDLKLKTLKMKLERASKEHSKEKLYCNICNKEFANLKKYKYHMQRHNGYDYVCEHCGKGFCTFAELNLHRVGQHGTGQHIQCKFCNFKAARKHDLIEHERLHTGERPYTCDKCGLTFRRRAIWRKHMIYHTEKTVQCPKCPKKFYRHSEMLAHTNSMHERLYLYACNVCNVTYAKTASVRRHLTEKHGIPREEQGRIIRINKQR